MEKQIYVSPQIEVVEVQIEQGFTASGDTSDYEYGGHFGPGGF